MFRDESERIIRNVRRSKTADKVLRNDSIIAQPGTIQSNAASPGCSSPLRSPRLAKLASLPSQSFEDLGVSFFFSNYTFYEPPFYSEHHTWLTQSYVQDKPNHVLRPAISAIGMAGFSNVHNAPILKSKAEEYHCTALAAIRQALNDPL